MAIGHITMYEFKNKEWKIYKDFVTLSVADSHVKHSTKRLVAVHHGVVIAASEWEDLDLVFDDIEMISL